MSESCQTPQTTRPTIVVGIPAFNEEQFIAEVVRKARRFADDVIVVDDGSRDGTSEAAKAAGAVVINHGVHKGYGESIKSCFEVMKLKNADVLVVLDGDSQHDPDDIPRLLAPIFSGGADVVVGSRFLGGQTNMPRYRKFGIKVITFLCNFGSRVKVSDAQSGFRAYRKKVVDTLTISVSGMGASAEVIMRIREKGFSIKEVPIRCLYHSKGSTLNPVIHGLVVVLTVVELRFKGVLRRLIGSSGA